MFLLKYIIDIRSKRAILAHSPPNNSGFAKFTAGCTLPARYGLIADFLKRQNMFISEELCLAAY